MMLVKICGTTSVVDGVKAERLGADFLGMIFVPRSKRVVTVERAGEIVASLGGGIRTVGVFANHDIDEVVSVTGQVGLSMVQLHGDEPPEYVDRLADALEGRCFLKAFAFSNVGTLDEMVDYYDRLEHGERLFAFLLEGPWGGGSGRCFDWSKLAEQIVKPRYQVIAKRLVLAGGLDADNVANAIELVDPIGVDVASGVERSAGVKDEVKLQEFISRAKARRKTDDT